MRHKVWNFHLLAHSHPLKRSHTQNNGKEISDLSFNYRFKKVKTKKIWPRLRKKLMALKQRMANIFL